jgi:hypothetical protein
MLATTTRWSTNWRVVASPTCPSSHSAASRVQSSTLSEVATQLGTTQMQTAFAWLLLRAPNILLIPGTSSIGHLRENLATAELVLPDEVCPAERNQQINKRDVRQGPGLFQNSGAELQRRIFFSIEDGCRPFGPVPRSIAAGKTSEIAQYHRTGPLNCQAIQSSAPAVSAAITPPK